MSQALQTSAPQPQGVMANESDPRTMIQAVKNRLAAVRELLKTELVGPTNDNPEGIDYGIIPGCKKPCLLQPGAEKIALMFQFVPTYTITRVELPGGHLEVCALCTLTHAPTGRMVGQAEGTASTMESKHRYRGAAGKACPKCGAVACQPSKKDWGGGYYCNIKAGGCGEAFKGNTPEAAALDKVTAVKTENLDPADQRNTVSKIAQKRAFLSATKGAAAASELFTVDVDELPPLPAAPPPPPVTMPTAKAPAAGPAAAPSAAAPATPTDNLSGLGEAAPLMAHGPCTSHNSKPTATASGGERSSVRLADRWYATFDKRIGAVIKKLTKDQPVEFAYVVNASGFNDIVTWLEPPVPAEAAETK